MNPEELEAAGWSPLGTRAFSAAIGQVWMRGEPGAREVCLPCGTAIANDHMGMVHGGALMTFADIALGVVTVDAIGGPWCSTAQLQYHFALGVKVGSLLLCSPELVRQTRRMVFTRGLFRVGEETVGSADAIYNVFEPKP
ncbi:PaaI family thioesterase [Novosphingobium sp. M1R2S20]|uniref:PaaI family thioesterase n=1 Tax=Novosphingobium rhizovicinum TaxID=3228928 RepID=A0ABV3R8D9_9SPHN